MACRGVHFAITDEDLAALRKASSDEEVMEVIEALETRWEEGFTCETDTAWDAIHRCLTDGRLAYNNGTEPLKYCVLGGELFYKGDDYIISLVPDSAMKSLCEALAVITPEWMAERYWQIAKDYADPTSAEDLQYTWDWFSNLPAFFENALKAGRHVVFTVDQ